MPWYYIRATNQSVCFVGWVLLIEVTGLSLEVPPPWIISGVTSPLRLHHALRVTKSKSSKMGRYTTVQSYSDNNANVRAISYDQARGTSSGGGGGGAAAGAAASAGGDAAGGGGGAGTVRADKVYNPYGSTAGAGSGEFHIYRHARSREMARMKALDEAEETAKADQDFVQKVEGWKDEEERKTAKRRKKRKREKEARERKKNLKLSGIAVGGDNHDDNNSGAGGAGDDDEFEYIPMQQQQQEQPAQETTDTSEADAKPAAVENKEKSPSKEEESTKAPDVPFANDGSFLEMMKRKLAEEEEAAKASGDAGTNKETGGDTTKDTADKMP